MLDNQLAWYVAGPILGLCVVACRALLNGRLGVTGGLSALVTALGDRTRVDWRGWFAIGVLAGGLLFALLGGSLPAGYGWLTETLDGTAGAIVTAVILLVSGAVIGYGAKLAGGCTSGNGLSGVSAFSPGALAGTATFFATAIVVSFAIEALR